MDIQQKLENLADAAKYDASCASSGSAKRNFVGGQGFYEFDAAEIFAGSDGMLELDIDPKLAWALRHRERFPVDVNRASREERPLPS